ncbi:MAG: glycoside hydrolase family 5 protein [Fervidobacterium sp.]
MWTQSRLALVIVLVILLSCSLLVASVYSQNIANKQIQSSGKISYVLQPLLRVNGIYIEDGLGNRVKLKGVQVDKNERMKKYGATYDANSPEETWFTEDDVRRIKEAGGNLIEIHLNPLTRLMPKRNVVNEECFAKWIDNWVYWATKYQIYVILDITGIGARWEWEIATSFPDWLWEGLYPTPTSKEEYDNIMRDFFDLNVSKQDINREAFINLWRFIAKRYKDNPYVMFSIMNEPFCGAYFMGPYDSNIALAQSYSTFMEMIVDAIRSEGAPQLIFINKPYLWDSRYRWTVQPVNRENIIWEDHIYVSDDFTIDQWKSTISKCVQKFVFEFGKPLFIGEYGFDPPNVIRTNYKDNWKDILNEQILYLDSLPIAGRQWHSYGHLDGEYYDFAMPEYTGDLTAEESIWILQKVLD